MEDGWETGGRSPMEMAPDEMRRLGYRVIDELVSRWTHLREDAAWEGATRQELEPILGGPAPESPGNPDDIIRTALEKILTKAGRIDHPRFFAFIPSSNTWPGLMGELLAAGFNVFQGTWLESAGPSQLELSCWTGFVNGSASPIRAAGS